MVYSARGSIWLTILLAMICLPTAPTLAQTPAERQPEVQAATARLAQTLVAQAPEDQVTKALCFPDTDGDGLCDGFEQALVERFFPNLWVSTLNDRVSFYSCIAGDPYAKVPYMVERVWYNPGFSGLACLQPDDCLLLKIGLAYDEDFGDDVFGGGHPGDSEFYYLLLSRVSFDRTLVKQNSAGETCTAFRAKQDATCWWAMVDWTSAHSGELTDSSYHAVLSPFVNTIGDSDATVIYAAEGKHANYHTDGGCDSGNIVHIDNCTPIANVRDTCNLSFHNIGNSVPLGGDGQGDGYPPDIRYPLRSWQRYDMWSFAEFADSSAYRPKFEVDGGHLWTMWYNCIIATTASQKLIYCGKFDIACRSDDSCSCYDSCSPNNAYTLCGNGVCSPNESCQSCAADCGPCGGPACGNSLCESGETCSNCPTDCGTCPTGPSCGDGLCQSSETCQTGGGAGQCQVDCGCCPGWQPVCFAPGTPVDMADGSRRAIEQVREGEFVMAYDEEHGIVVPARVTKTFRHEGSHQEMVEIDGWLQATSNHPFYVEGRSETVPAGKLELGDPLLTLDQLTQERGPSPLRSKPIDSLHRRPAKDVVFNLEVEGHHNYFVGGLLVHNKTGSAGCEPGDIEF